MSEDGGFRAASKSKSIWTKTVILFLSIMTILMASGCTEGEIWFWNNVHNDSWMTCVRQRESGEDYSINTGNGYRGAYQFLQTTWDSNARTQGVTRYVGTPVDQVPWFIQDWVVYGMKLQGLKSQWGTNRMCGG